jgi:hypothetical protein
MREGKTDSISRMEAAALFRASIYFPASRRNASSLLIKRVRAEFFLLRARPIDLTDADRYRLRNRQRPSATGGFLVREKERE